MTEPSARQRLRGLRRGAPTRGAQWARIADRAEWRLTEHFFRAMFDFGVLTQAGADSFKHMLLGAIGGFIAAGLLLTRIFIGRYAALAGAVSPEPYRLTLLGDDLLIIGLPMLLVAFVTLLVSDSLFPDERDFRILGPLPVRREVVFGAKLAALFLFTGLFVAASHVSLVPLMLVTSMNPWREHTIVSRLTAWAVASVSASALAALGVTAIVGVLVLALSRSRLHALTAMMRSFMLGMLVLCVPFVFHFPALGASFASGSAWLAVVPPAWFVGLQRVLLGGVDPWFVQLTAIALAAAGAAATIVAVIYTLLFKQFERLMIRPAATSPRRSTRDRTTAFSHATSLHSARDGPTGRGEPLHGLREHRELASPVRDTEKTGEFPLFSASRAKTRLCVLAARGFCHGLRSEVEWPPAFRAVYRFTITTLGRSQLHQSVLVGFSACGVGIAVNRLIGADLAPSSLASAAMWTPFVTMFACGLGVRAALALPMEQRANWIFRLTEDEATRHEQLRAVDQVVTLYVVGVPVAAAVPVLWLALGPASVIAAAVVALVGLVFVHAVLLDWRRIPFTCSYLPGKRFVGHSLLFGVVAFLLFTLSGSGLVRAATEGTRQQALVIAAALSLVAWLLRRRRLAIWRKTPLMFEDEFPDRPLQLRL